MALEPSLQLAHRKALNGSGAGDETDRPPLTAREIRALAPTIGEIARKLAESFGERLRYALTRAGMEQAEAAKILDVSRQTIQRWLSEDVSIPHKYSVKRFKTLCDALKVAPQWLLYGVGPMDPKEAAKGIDQTIKLDRIREIYRDFSAIYPLLPQLLEIIDSLPAKDQRKEPLREMVKAIRHGIRGLEDMQD